MSAARPAHGSRSVVDLRLLPGALAADRARYLLTQTIRDIFEHAGFTDVHTNLAQHIPAASPFSGGVNAGT